MSVKTIYAAGLGFLAPLAVRAIAYYRRNPNG